MMDVNADTYMREAILEAEAALHEGEMPVGCVIADADGQIIGRAHNRREAQSDPTAHAEILAIRQAAAVLGDWRLSGCTLFVTLEPCPMCAGAIVMARLARVVYGASDRAAGCAGSVYRITEDPSFNHYAPSDGGVLTEECAQLIEEFFLARRQQP